jgi:hypothetical protein
VTALSGALVVLGVLAYAAWRDWLKLHVVVPPHEALKAEVAALREDLSIVKSWANVKGGGQDD